jgi:hypothetical protein
MDLGELRRARGVRDDGRGTKENEDKTLDED